MTKTCKFSSEEFNRMQYQYDINKLDKMIGIIKRDKTKYMLLVCILAIALNEISTCFAETYSFEAGLNNSCNQIIDLLLVIAQYVFLFTYHVVNIKPFEAMTADPNLMPFTYHVVNIKQEKNQQQQQLLLHLHIT